MIRVEKIVIHEFRGIRDLELDLNNNNFAICGPNGTGKSGIVDAIEFALTGNISRLEGSGTGEVSIKEHAPHVDSRNKPDQASVTVLVFIPSLNKKATILRTVKNSRKPKITPDDTEIITIINDIQLHPEFTLSRRELIRYVLSEPGKRSKEVQALLRLDELETLRAMLQKIANSSEKAVAPLERTKQEASTQLSHALNIPQLSMSAVLVATNERRAILSLPALEALEANTSIKDGLATISSTGTGSRIPKIQALADIKALRELLNDFGSPNFEKSCQNISKALEELNSDALELDSISKEKLLQSALSVFDGRACPVCDTLWKPEEFRQVIFKKLKLLEDAARKRANIEKQLLPISDKLTQLASSLSYLSNYGSMLNQAANIQAVKIQISLIAECATQLRNVLPVDRSLKIIDEFDFCPTEIIDIINDVESAINMLPEPSLQDAAREFLTIGQERLEAYRKIALQVKAAKERATVARTVSDLYGAVTTDALNGVYKCVERSFSEFYSFIHREDEEAFQARLTPSIGRLGFDVDFYGRGFFPPGAYHSEGHQDGMGLCLYLALMEHLFKKNFTFAVLDDVLMSVDSGHRREVSRLLREKFQHTQFIMTTHDEIWLRHMKSTGLIEQNAFVQFRTWDVECGPTEWDDRDVWQELDGYLEKNDVRSAAGLLRHYLEHLSKEICHRLRASVEFRGDAQFVLSDLLPNAIGSLRKLIKTGKTAAQSWGKANEFQALVKYDDMLTEAVKKSNVEQWQMNAAVHFNEWATLQKEDFIPVVGAYKSLIAEFKCPDCGLLLYVTPDRGKKESLRCGCANVNINLISK